MTGRRRSIDRFIRDRARANKYGAKRTAEIYGWAADRLDLWLTSTDDDREFADLDRDALEDFLDAFARGKEPFTEHADSYVNQIYRSLVSFFDWVVDEYELPASPMVKVRPREVGEQRIDGKVLTKEQLVAILDTVAYDRKDFAAIRDHAMLRLLLTGMRRAELVGLTVDAINLEAPTARVHGKADRRGQRIRYVTFGDKTITALDRYLERRDRHPLADRPELWLGRRGVITGRGFHAIVKKRGEQAGIDGVHPHQFRHTSADLWLADGGSESELMENHGWESLAMPRYYAKETAAKRARESYRRRAIDDRI